VGHGDREVVDAGDAQAHQPLLVELPILVAIGSEVLAAVVAPLVRKADGDSVASEPPEFLDQPIVELPDPLPGEKLDDRRTSLEELGPVPPAAVLAVGEGDG